MLTTSCHFFSTSRVPLGLADSIPSTGPRLSLYNTKLRDLVNGERIYMQLNCQTLSKGRNWTRLRCSNQIMREGMQSWVFESQSILWIKEEGDSRAKVVLV